MGEDKPIKQKINPRVVSAVLRAAGFRPRGAQRIVGYGGFQASRMPDGVAVSHRCGQESDDLTRDEEVQVRKELHDAYADVLMAAGYVLSERKPGEIIIIWDPR